jgi:hypothetical protein
MRHTHLASLVRSVRVWSGSCEGFPSGNQVHVQLTLHSWILDSKPRDELCDN